MREIAALLACGRSVVADWALLKQPIFAATTLDGTDTARITATVEVWAGSLPTPDALIGLSATTATLHDRIRRRGRAMEAVLTDAHLTALSAAFETAYAGWPRPLIRVDATTFDAFDSQHLSELAAQVRQLPIPVESR
ncbi:deoxynucleoside kinase [Frankia sp. Cppng1_Ct_nod]|uniref:deoxynucleoside kinase n=1 Tax=Frankia sp. Cppng1_Ct_nod TaxID=2897162 RepID=UPI0020249A4A|nr:deoxynucleoside kinase [Frankia sp. Cppng1_Ct_nod]